MMVLDATYANRTEAAKAAKAMNADMDTPVFRAVKFDGTYRVELYTGAES